MTGSARVVLAWFSILHWLKKSQSVRTRALRSGRSSASTSTPLDMMPVNRAVISTSCLSSPASETESLVRVSCTARNATSFLARCNS
eukprot:CAMPEP_0119117322 /NCGR_PEP_ID=MMETSP1180-20130426/52775_1 /TAXON_ID=3052 ORGANISM="Chlamydomonas cf sp, Strain CCMP681" /NCGR_SAMPLE_ID=MMETSP1180 /ASSEMBLY_ACC=CAM_ASM_000741 /LENGTH=86 /DNA_ID=CAMNT_0007106567 /DNA_START=629 /DNA_END=889 /DNA_ORIENTATION=-